MDLEKRKKIANNILEFLFDPTVIPIERRMYFRPEEILKNQSYEQAKAESNKTYGDQRSNSDFYPPKNKMSNESEASSMDRKTLIASMDILSQTFQENDPIGKDLRTMAYAVAKMSDEELESRMVEAGKGLPPWLMKDDKGKVVKNPDFKKEKKKADEAEETKEAAEETPQVDMDVWSKEASEAVKKALIADVVGDKEAGCKPAEDEEEEEVDAKKKAETDKKEVSSCDPAEDDEAEKTKEAGKKKGPGVPDGTGPMKDSPECPINKDKEAKEEKIPEEEEKEEVDAKKKADEEPVETKEAEEEKEATEPTIVNTEILGIEMAASFLTPEDIGDLSPEESAKLDQLFK